MTQVPETGRNDHRPPDGLDPAPVDEPCRVVVVPLASGQSVTVSMRSVAPLTGEEEAALGEIVRAAAARMEREHPHAGVITALWQASLRSRVVLRAAGEGDLADRLGVAIRSAADVIRAAWVSGVASSLRSTPEDLNQAAGGSGPGGVTRREEIAQAILAWFHDGSTTEWPGEIDAYRSLAGHLLAAGGLGADRGSRFRWAEEAAEADVRAVSEQARANVLAWLHAEAAWKRDQFRDSAVAYAAQVAELKAELAGLRKRAVILPEDAATQLADAASWTIWRDALPAARDAFAHLIESWRAAPEPATSALGVAEEGVRLAAAIGTAPARTEGRCPEHGEPCSMHHGPFQCAPEPAAPTQAPVSLVRDPDDPSSVEAAEREWHLCHNAGSHHITDTFHGNDCDRPEHWEAPNA